MQNLKVRNLILVSVMIAVGAIFVLGKNKNKEIVVEKPKEKIYEPETRKVKDLTILPECKKERPVAVMLSSDEETRPLSGIGGADVVFEAPVLSDGTTRLMAVFICRKEKDFEIGSVRSARMGFISLASTLDAVFAHWGGEARALEFLKSGILQNIDALPNPLNVFYRKKGISMPHDGFTTLLRLKNTAGFLGYRKDGRSLPYKFLSPQVFSEAKPQKVGNEQVKPTHSIQLDSKISSIEYVFDTETGKYLRFRLGRPELERGDGQQVAVKNLAVLHSRLLPFSKDYSDIVVYGQNRANYFMDGRQETGFWKKASSVDAPLLFFNDKGEEISFAPGNVWIHFIDSAIYKTGIKN